MAAAEEDAIEKILKFEGAEKEMSKKIFEDVSKKSKRTRTTASMTARASLPLMLVVTWQARVKNHSDTICWSEKNCTRHPGSLRNWRHILRL